MPKASHFKWKPQGNFEKTHLSKFQTRPAF